MSGQGAGPANPWAGEVEIVIDGARRFPRLTLGALVEVEAALGAGSLVALVRRFEEGDIAASDIMAVLLAGLHAAGWPGDAAALGRARIEGGPLEGARVAARLVAAAFAFPPGHERAAPEAGDAAGAEAEGAEAGPEARPPCARAVADPADWP